MKPAGANEAADTSDFPVENVSWQEANEFCRKLTAKDDKKPFGWMYRLPTEAEWEYACRGSPPSSQLYHFGNSISSKQANFNGNHPYGGGEKGPDLERTCKVGSYEANRFGLYDMHGNVSEWCSDWYDYHYYRKSPRRDPPGPVKGVVRVVRGGGWGFNGRSCRSACRQWPTQGDRCHFIGFRVALVPFYPGRKGGDLGADTALRRNLSALADVLN
jgi:formylglycine-generating enzyme required for sulfatase activity